MVQEQAAQATRVTDGEQGRFSQVPTELQAVPQWIVWRFGDKPNKKGKFPKQPVDPRTGYEWDAHDPHHWTSFGAAQEACKEGGYPGIGFVFSADDPFMGVDLDDCRDPDTEQIAPWAWDIIIRLRTYTEVSPSDKGVKLFLRATKPGPRIHPPKSDARQIEVYDKKHYFTVTGRHLAGTPTTVEARQAELSAFYAEVIEPEAPGEGGPSRSMRPRTQRRSSRPAGPLTAHSPTSAGSVSLSDDQLLHLAKASKNGAKFTRLWEGDTSDAGDNLSVADMSLCQLLAFWTAKDAERIDRLLRQSGLFHLPGRADKWDSVHYADGSTYGQMTIARAIADQHEVYTPSRRDDRRKPLRHPWHLVRETAQDREKQRRQLSAHIAEQVRAHLEHASAGTAADAASTLLVVTAPPGSGKSTKVAELGMGRDIAYIAERHDVTESIDSLPYYHHLRAPAPETCPHYALHAHFAGLGFNTLQWHQSHGCAYAQQFGRSGSTVYMVEHVPTPYPARHQDGIVIDEMSLTKWLHEHQFTAADLRAALLAAPANSAEAHLLRAVDMALLEAERGAGTAAYPPPVHGRVLFDALNRHCDGHLSEVEAQLTADEEALNPRRALSPDHLARPDAVVPNILPHLLAALQQELPEWQPSSYTSDTDWNSRVRLARVRLDGRGGKQKHWVLGITEHRRFHIEASPARALLDATADEETLDRLFDGPVHIVADEVLPPPHMRHLHLHVRYDLTSMRARQDRDRQRAIRQAKYLLHELNPDGSKLVGLITFKECVGEMGEALGIPPELRGWFWAERGSNKKANCDILLVVGTPAVPPDEVARLVRALYEADPMPIDTHSEKLGGRRHYADPRMQHLSDVLTNAELTQCAHRNRPLWHDGRVVVTFCQGTIDHLPITEHIEALPQLDEDGTRTDARREADRAERCRSALLRFLREDHWPTREQMRQATGLGQAYVSEWMREEAPQVREEFERERRQQQQQ